MVVVDISRLLRLPDPTILHLLNPPSLFYLEYEYKLQDRHIHLHHIRCSHYEEPERRCDCTIILFESYILHDGSLPAYMHTHMIHRPSER